MQKINSMPFEYKSVGNGEIYKKLWNLYLDDKNWKPNSEGEMHSSKPEDSYSDIMSVISCDFDSGENKFVNFINKGKPYFKLSSSTDWDGSSKSFRDSYFGAISFDLIKLSENKSKLEKISTAMFFPKMIPRWSDHAGIYLVYSKGDIKLKSKKSLKISEVKRLYSLIYNSISEAFETF